MGAPLLSIMTDGFDAADRHLQELSRTTNLEIQQILQEAAQHLTEKIEDRLRTNHRWAEADIDVTYSVDDESVIINVHGDGVYTLEWGDGSPGSKSPMLMQALSLGSADASDEIYAGLSNLFKVSGSTSGVQKMEWQRYA